MEFAGPQGKSKLLLDTEDIAGRSRRLVNRKPEVGLQKNERRVLNNGERQITVGRINTQDWLDRVNTNLTPDEIFQARTWYRDAKAVFDEAFGAESSELMLAAWLLANKNESPSGALRNALRIAEQLQSGARVRKKGGLSDDVLRRLLNGEEIESGVGRKLFDFMDAEAGR